jgi:hypothetical protein
VTERAVTVVTDSSGNRVANYGEYWLDFPFQLDAGEEGKPDVLIQGGTTRQMLDSSTMTLPGSSSWNGYTYNAAASPAAGASFSQRVTNEIKSNSKSPRKAQIESVTFTPVANAKSDTTLLLQRQC